MTVSSISSQTDLYPTTGAQNSFRKDFKALQSALQSGDLSSAQQAFTALQKDNPNFAQAMSGSNSSSQTNPVSTAFQSLQSALQSGNLSGAQSAFTSLTQALQSTHKGHHHHHHHSAGTQASSASASSTTPSSASGTINTLA
jgi:outer membrane protein assembly factor BamD (BamD/ComL family)